MRKAAALAGTVGSVLFAGVLIILTSMLLFGWTFRSIPAWRSLSTYTWLTAAAAVPTFALKGAAFYLFLAGVLAWTLIVARKLNNLDERSFPPKASERN